MTKLLLPFNGIFDFLKKADKIKLAHELVNKLHKQHLLDNGIPFNELGDMGVIIDLSKVPEDKKQFIENKFNGILEEVYKQVGVIENTNGK